MIYYNILKNIENIRNEINNLKEEIEKLKFVYAGDSKYTEKEAEKYMKKISYINQIYFYEIYEEAGLDKKLRTIF